MSPRTLASLLFVLCALLLGGVILKPWLAGRPARRPSLGSQMQEDRQNSVAPGLLGASADARTWRLAPRPTREAVLASIRGQLAAFREDDYARAFQYQSLGLRRNFAGPAAFRAQISQGYPEFAHSRRVQFGPVAADRSQRRAAVVVTVTGQNGSQAQGLFLMVREDKAYHVGGVMGGRRRPLAPASGN